LSFERFISSRLIKQKHLGLKGTKPIVRISIFSIALAILVNSLTLAIVVGFQDEIKAKIIGFNAPFFISKAGSAHIFEAEPIDQRIPFLDQIKSLPQVERIDAVAYKPALLQSQKFADTIRIHNHKDSVIERQDIFGVMFKGVASETALAFIQKHLLSGQAIDFKQADQIIVSENIAKKLNYHLNDRVSVYYIKQQPILKKMRIVGIYKTGFAEYDQKLVYTSLAAVQQMSDFGTRIALRPLIENQLLTINSEITGSAERLIFDWGNGPEPYTAYRVAQFKDTTYKIQALRAVAGSDKLEIIDESSLTIQAPRPIQFSDFILDESGNPVLLIDGATHQAYQTKYGPLHFYFKDGVGTTANYISGFEVAAKDFSGLDALEQQLKATLEMRPVNGHLLQVNAVKDTEADLFAWLSFLDVNVMIIIVLMLVIGVINVGSALLVLIVLRTQFIGLLKALGANNRSIRTIFLYQAAYLVFRGLLLGNAIAISLIFLQKQFGFFTLNPEVYYLEVVPVQFSWLYFLGINLLTFLVCILALLLPSRVVARISPVKALRFQ
jgi:lipoprotein-releasing system permease protein